MNLEQQVVSLDLAKRLKEWGVKQESLVYWCDIPIITPPQYELEIRPFPDKRAYSAFTVAELGEMLPPTIKHEQRRLGLTSIAYSDGWEVGYQTADGKWATPGDDLVKFATTEADARAQMLIYLIENKLIAV
jgi:hypothetical protein